MSTLPHAPGIYKITCTVNSKIYIGSSVNILKRWQNHKSDLNKGKHHSPHLQRAWDKYGESAFQIDVVELVNVDFLEQKEQEWIDATQCHKIEYGFNISKYADSPTRGRELSDEHKRKVGEASKQLWLNPEYRERQRVSRTGKKRTPEQCANIGRIHKGKVATDEQRKKLSDSHKGIKLKPESVAKRSDTVRKHYIVTTPEGQEITVKGMDVFCKENNLPLWVMYKMANGKRKKDSYMGWKCRHV